MKPGHWSAYLGRGLALLAVGTAGALAAQGMGIPAGVIVGALLTSGLYRLAGGDPGPWQGRYGRLGRLLLGTVIGAAFGPDVIAPLKAALLPMVALIAIIVGVGLGLGWALGRFTWLDVSTALISSVPGGLPAMAATAEEIGAEVIRGPVRRQGRCHRGSSDSLLAASDHSGGGAGPDTPTGNNVCRNSHRCTFARTSWVLAHGGHPNQRADRRPARTARGRAYW